jgi:ABC-type transport system substrate-binding protein
MRWRLKIGVRLWLTIPLIGIAIATVLSSALAAGPIQLRLQLFSLNLDPATMADVDSRLVATLLHSGLVAVNLDGTIEPRAASSWVRRDAQTWEFTLRRNLAFPDGTPIDATVIVRSLCAAMQPTHLWAWSLASIQHKTAADGKTRECIGLTAPSSYVVRIRESKMAPWLFEALAGPGGWIVPPSVAVAGDRRKNYGNRAGLGPYLIDRIDPDSQVVLRARSDTGAVLKPQVSEIVFRYVPDASVAAKMFEGGALDVLQIDNPQVYRLLVRDRDGKPQLVVPGTLRIFPAARIRTVLINLNALTSQGFSSEQAHAFRRAYSREVDRQRLLTFATPHGEPLYTAFPPALAHAGLTSGGGSTPRQEAASAAGTESLTWPKIRLTLLTNNDSYSDLLAANLPKQVGAVQISYRAVDFGVMLGDLLSGKYEMVAIVIESTVNAPVFWSSFWTPSAPFVFLGRPLSALAALNLSEPRDLRRAADLIDREGNWVPLLKEAGLVALSPRIIGVRLTPSGQLSLETIAVPR